MAELTQQERETFICSICGWKGKTPSLKGLSVHKGRAHRGAVPEPIIAPVNESDPKAAPLQVQAPLEAQVPVVAPVIPVMAPVAAPVQELAPGVNLITKPFLSEPVTSPEPIQEQAPVPSVVENAEVAEEFVETPVDESTLKPEVEPESTIQVPVEVPALKPPMPIPNVLNPKVLGIKEILVGSILKLQGPHFVFTGSEIKGPEIAEGIQVKVNYRWEDTNSKKYYVRARSEGGSQQWVVSERDVLDSNNVQLISLGEREIPANYVAEETPTPPEDLPEDTGPSPEEKAQQQEFLKMLERYTQFRDKKVQAEKEFKAVDQETRPVILDYVGQFGTESEEGKGDNVLLLDGYKTHWTYTPGESYIQRDEPKILKYLHDNYLYGAMQSKVNWDVWEKLKENGTIPSSVVAEVEKPAKREDFRKLLVEADYNFKS